jgi:four helix bundle protein
MITSFKDLIVWQKSMDLIELIYQVTEKLPSKENFGLISQMQRASISIPSNIAEGYGRQSSGSYGQFLSIARGSLFELETQAELCLRLKYIQRTEYEGLCPKIAEISKMLTSLISKIK